MTTTNSLDSLKEKLAAIEHERWSDWQSWCHKILRKLAPSPELEKVLERWDKQIATEYYDLTDREKDADMEQVNRYWPLIVALIDTEIAKELEIIRDIPGKNLYIVNRLATLTKGKSNDS